MEHLEPRMLLNGQPLAQQTAATFTTLYSSGLEVSEGFTTGLLGTQNGWYSLPDCVTQPTITTANPASGEHSLRIAQEPTVASGTTIGAYSPFLDTMVDGEFRVSIDVSISALWCESFYVVPLSASHELPTAEVAFAMTGHIMIGNQVTFGSGGTWTDTGVSWVVGAYRTLVIDVNDSTDTISYSYGGTSLGTSTLFAGTVVESVAVGGDNYSAGATADYDNIVIERAAPPTLTDGNIALSGATGTGGAFRIGDTVTATWNNTATGDANPDTITSVTVDFSQFGGGSAVAAVNTGNVWTATYAIPSGSLDATGLNVSVKAINGSGSTTTADTTNATVDSQAPTVTAAKISLSGATGTGTGSTFRIGDTVTVAWNNTASGDANTDTIAAVSVDFSQFGGGSAVAAANSGEVWTATYTLAAGALEATGCSVALKATDNAGNAITVTDDATAAVDLVRPTVDTLVPADDETDVAFDANLGITFSEDVQLGSGNLVIRLASDGSVVETIDVNGSLVTFSDAEVTIDPDTTLAAETEYYVEVDAGAFLDLAGNAITGISGATAWSFTTASSDNLDVDGNGAADALTDGILILRYLFDPPGTWNYSDALGANATRTTRPAIRSYLDGAAGTVLDADGNGSPDALTDGILILRYLFDRAGAWNYSDALGANATRTTRDSIRAFLDVYNPNLALVSGADSAADSAEAETPCATAIAASTDDSAPAVAAPEANTAAVEESATTPFVGPIALDGDASSSTSGQASTADVSEAAVAEMVVVEEPLVAPRIDPSALSNAPTGAPTATALKPQRVDAAFERWDRPEGLDARLIAVCAWVDATEVAGDGEEFLAGF